MAAARAGSSAVPGAEAERADAPYRLFGMGAAHFVGAHASSFALECGGVAPQIYWEWVWGAAEAAAAEERRRLDAGADDAPADDAGRASAAETGSSTSRGSRRRSNCSSRATRG